MFLLDAITKFKFPLRIQLLEDLKSLNDGQVINAGEIITIYGFARQLLVTTGSLEHPTADNDESDEYVNMKPERKVYIPENCCEKLKDVHCNGKIYEDVGKIKEQMPRFLKAERDFFVFYVDEDKGMARIKKGDILEFVRVIDTGNPGAYHNISCSQNEKNLVIYRSEGEEIILTENKSLKLICIADDNAYSTTELLDNFSFPRKMLFVNSDLQDKFENFTNISQQVILDLTEKPRLFFTSELQSPFTNTVSYKISLFQNVNLLCLCIKLISRIQVEIVQEAAGGNGVFELLFAKENENKDKKQGNFTTFEIYGKFLSEKLENSEIEIPPLPNSRKHTSKNKLESQPNYETIFPPKGNTKADNNKTALVSPDKSLAKKAKSFQHEGNVHKVLSQPGEEEQPVFSNVNENQNAKRSSNSCRTSQSVQEFNSHKGKSENVPLRHSLSVPNKKKQPFLRTENQHELPQTTQEKQDNLTVSVDKAKEEKKDNNIMTKDDNVEIMGNIKDMGKKGLYHCLTFCGLPAFAEQCRLENLDGSFVSEMEDEELTDEPYFLKKHELRKFHRIKEGWRPKE